jgi:hypothetical protein
MLLGEAGFRDRERIRRDEFFLFRRKPESRHRTNRVGRNHKRDTDIASAFTLGNRTTLPGPPDNREPRLTDTG